MNFPKFTSVVLKLKSNRGARQLMDGCREEQGVRGTAGRRRDGARGGDGERGGEGKRRVGWEVSCLANRRQRGELRRGGFQ